MLVRETAMCDDIDLYHEWDTVEEAIASGRFEYIYENGFDDEYDDDGNITYCYYDDLVDKSKTIEEFIENVGYPFYEVKD